MMTRKRKGNMVLAVVILVLLLTTLVSLLSINVAQKNNARSKAADAGDVNSYVSMANVCAWAFKDDLEAQAMSMVVADVSNPSGEDIGIEIFDQAIAAFQQALQQDRALAPAAPWVHALSNPYDAIEFAGITDSKATRLMQRILDNATVTLTVNNVLTIIGAEEENVAVEDGASVTIGDIYFDVVLTKGTWKVTQSYCISGEKLAIRFDGSMAFFTIDSEAAECLLERQTVSRTFKNNN